MKKGPNLFPLIGCNLILLHFVFGYLTGVGKYSEQLLERIADGIEHGDVTGKLMPMNNFENEMHLVEFGLDVSGRAKFEAGFVRSIESVSSHGEIGGISATKSFVNVTLQLHGVSVVYDVHYSLKEFNGHGTIEFHLPVLAFHLELSRNHDSMEKTGSMNFLFTAGDADITTRFHPDNGYTQLWAREMRNNAPFRTGLVKAFGDWRNSWQELLQDAVNSVPFPDTCYDCP